MNAIKIGWLRGHRLSLVPDKINRTSHGVCTYIYIIVIIEFPPSLERKGIIILSFSRDSWRKNDRTHRSMVFLGKQEVPRRRTRTKKGRREGKEMASGTERSRKRKAASSP